MKVPAVVDAATWTRAQTAISSRRAETKWKHDRQCLLSGVATCGVCGYAMWVVNTRPNHWGKPYYRCATSNGWRWMGRSGPCGNKHHRVSSTDEAVWERIVAVLSDPKLLAEACSLSTKASRDGVDWNAQARSSRRRLAELERLEAELLARRRRGQVSAGACDRELAEIARERKLVEHNRDVADRQAAKSNAVTDSARDIRQRAAALVETVKGASFEEKRKLVRLVVPREHGCEVKLHRDGRIETVGILPMAGEKKGESAARAVPLRLSVARR